MNRIDQRFKELRKIKKAAFIAFLTCGDPDLAVTKRLILELENRGTDIVELGIPFSDPLADGATIQASSQRALKNNITLANVLNLARDIRRSSNVPLVLMSYYNPIYRFGLEGFSKQARESGIDGVIVADLPPEEASSLVKGLNNYKIHLIFFLSPTTPLKRARLIAGLSRGFIYYLSLTGVTGARDRLSPGLIRHLRQLKTLTDKPICVGFGLSRPEQVRKVSKICDGVIVGSAIIQRIEKFAGRKDLVKKVGDFAQTLIEGLKVKPV